MSTSLDELSAQINANIQAVNEVVQQVEASKASCEELAGHFTGLGNQSVPGVLEQAKTKLEEVVNQGAAQVKSLEEAQATVESAKQA